MLENSPEHGPQAKKKRPPTWATAGSKEDSSRAGVVWVRWGEGGRVWGEVKRFAAHECVLYRCPTEIERKSYFEMNAWELHHMSSKHNGQEKLDRE